MQIFVNEPCKCIGPQRAIFFEKKAANYCMHFSTQKTTEDNRIQYDWHCVNLKKDFIDTLTKFGRLPYANPKEPLSIIKVEREKTEKLKRTICLRDEKINSTAEMLAKTQA